jgi:hypothetical protein
MKRGTTSLSLALLASLLGACGHSDSTYGELAARVNPTLKKLSEIAAPLFADDASARASAANIVSACLAAEPELAALRTVDFHDRRAARKAGTEEVSSIVFSLLERRPTMCMPETGDGTRTATCQAWCIERWRSLATAVELVQKSAKQHDVDIVSLRLSK